MYSFTEFPKYREPVHRLLSPAELKDAQREFQIRREETESYYRRAVRHGNIARRHSLSTSMKLLERQEQLFMAEQEEYLQGVQNVA